MNKCCFKCKKEKPLTDFYAHPWMRDGRLNKCKECTKKDVQDNYANKREQYSKYDRARQQNPERRKKKQEYLEVHRKKYPEKNRARRMVQYALKNRILTKKPCQTCGTTENIHAHHTDYSKPLEVEWYCGKHHRMTHGKNS